MNTPYHEKPYETGYGKPPKAHRFKKGQSGNPKGRKKGTKNLKTDLEEVLKSKIPISEAGKKKSVTKQRGMILALIAKALKGDVKATNTVLKLLAETVGYNPQADKESGLSLDDAAILDLYVQQLSLSDDKIAESALGETNPADSVELVSEETDENDCEVTDWYMEAFNIDDSKKKVLSEDEREWW